jgi:hypothetical protein
MLAFNLLHAQMRNINPAPTISNEQDKCPVKLIYAAVMTSQKLSI